MEVYSFGPDGSPRTSDDISVTRVAMNLKGIGNGIKENAEEVSNKSARGVVKGIVEGAKESLAAAKKKNDKN